jgi:8-oxo-dGTP pyrophosphatase MutT (NUDIX family)
VIEPWQKVTSEPVGDFRIFTIRSDRKISPRTKAEHDFYVIDCVDWVNVVAVTPAQELVMIRQYRHGSNTVELEIPGGMIDREDPSPLAAGVRELREETGFEGEGAQIIGQVFPNPAIMSNTCYTRPRRKLPLCPLGRIRPRRRPGYRARASKRDSPTSRRRPDPALTRRSGVVQL